MASSLAATAQARNFLRFGGQPRRQVDIWHGQRPGSTTAVIPRAWDPVIRSAANGSHALHCYNRAFIPTVKAYSSVDLGGAGACTYNGCRNFVVVRDRVFPARFISFLDSLGVDPCKDGEVCHNALLAPGQHDYGGWFHFVGSLDRTGDFAPVDFGDGFTAWLSRRGAPALPALKDLPLVQLEFHATHVPWGLSEPEAM